MKKPIALMVLCALASAAATAHAGYAERGGQETLREAPAMAPVAAERRYPEREREEYILTCTLAMGETAEMRERCACSIDAIARIMPYERYVQAETVLRMRSISGPRAALYRDAPGLDDMVSELRTAQAASKAECF